MSDQPNSGNNNSSGGNRPANNNNPNNNNNNRRHQHPNQSNVQRPPQNGSNAGAKPQQRPAGQAQAQPGGQPQGQGAGQRRRPNRNNNRPRNPNQGPNNNPNANNTGSQGLNIEKIYEKYLNLLDQHLIARRKYHDLFYRADPGQKNKLERNFYNTMNDIREFESKMAPDARALFEKRNNGLSPDNIYTTNHEIPVTGENPPPETEWADPHFLQSQKLADYALDKEESVGVLDDYLKYKNLI
jgi:hypothetical protein